MKGTIKIPIITVESFIWHCWKYKLLCHQGFTHNEPVLFIHHNLINWDHIYLLCNMKFKKYFKINARKSIYYHILNPDDSYGVPKILLAITSLYDMLAFLLWQKTDSKKYFLNLFRQVNQHPIM